MILRINNKKKLVYDSCVAVILRVKTLIKFEVIDFIFLDVGCTTSDHAFQESNKTTLAG